MSYSSESGSDQEDNPPESSLAYPHPYKSEDFGTGIYFNLNKKVECKNHPNPIVGKALYAKEPIPEGDFIWFEKLDQLYTELVSVEQIEAARHSDPNKYDYYLRYGFQITMTHLAIGEVDNDASFYMNHSCDPNCWFEGENKIVARRNIQQGEELTYDYATTDTLYTDFTNCMCNSKQCRRYISCRDWQRKDLQEKYGNHFVPYILRALNQGSSQHTLDAQLGVTSS
eukprot:TRINITY_DN3032_c0_g1_i1.p1 TRINITY_DN3032_c0_g1~~TRINITY_DN3032_c0_g1_i1.p1  ORF type:complete len:227 (-),score=32.20 TRINITY_DN3032_c0_g1_i1:280-960(-)